MQSTTTGRVLADSGTRAEIRAIYATAAELLTRRGWQQGGPGDVVDGPICLTRAIELAALADVPASDESLMRMYDARAILREVLGLDSSTDLVWWNDGSDRTFGDVISALRAAAERVAA